MIKLSNPFKTGRIPTVLGLLLLLLVITITVTASQAVGSLTRFFSQADTVLDISSTVQISNVTDTSFTVSWTSEKPTIGRAFVGQSADNLDQIYTDLRDQNGSVNSYQTHYVRVTGLTADTNYFVKVGEAQPEFGTSTGEAVAVRTWVSLEARSLDPVFGSVNEVGGGGLAGAIVLWQASGAEPLSTLTSSGGSYVIPVALARAQGGGEWFHFSDNTKETLTVYSGSLISLINCDSDTDKPVVTVTIGQNTNCQARTVVASGSGQSGFNPPVGQRSTGLLEPSTKSAVEVNISHGQTVNNSQPTVAGKTSPNEMVSITIHSDTVYSGTVKASPDGSWSWTPPGTLSPGEHTVTIKVSHEDGTVTTETRTFFVSGSEEILPLTSGTPSATLQHFACVNNACVQLDGAGADECVNSNDCTPALPPPVEEPEDPPVVAVPVATPTTGTFENTIIVLTLGLGLLTLGAGVFIHDQRGE